MTDNGQACACACHNGHGQPCDVPGGCVCTRPAAGASQPRRRTAKKQQTCRHVGDGIRLVNGEHLRDCNASGCEGCKPCEPEYGHCSRCKHVHLDADHPRTCPTCVGKVRQDVLEIGDQLEEAHRQYLSRAVGSIAFMLTGPAANVEAGSYVHQSATSGRLCKCAQRRMVCPSTLPDPIGPMCDPTLPVLERCTHETCRIFRRSRVCPDAAWILEDLRADSLHPYTMFGAWELAWRRHLGQPEPDTEHTTWSAAVYLLGKLTDMAQDEDADFDTFSREISDSRSWLEDVLRLGHRPDLGGLCPMCKKERLVRSWDDEDEGTEYDSERDRKVYADFWQCPNPACLQEYKPEEYRDRAHKLYVRTADRLCVTDLATRLRISASTLRNWTREKKDLLTPVQVVDGKLVDAVWKITPAKIKHVGLDAVGRKLYLVADAQALRDNQGKAAS